MADRDVFAGHETLISEAKMREAGSASRIRLVAVANRAPNPANARPPFILIQYPPGYSGGEGGQATGA